ncbi:hypothetical protein [Sphingorhabdus sp. Alg239-R122]|uniref:beta strand repeat-containing protein n=1 Tax=Sphingorhabdus sp. Alg239-R122 TaxID=2305989 RepID=UPI0013DA0538|nr:hypothetical protein [Sphingorhabdus sp. Alg239-R122]
MAQTASKDRRNDWLMQHVRCRSLLLSSGSASAAALALMFAPLPAHAQSMDSAISAVEGTGSVTSGSATIAQTSTQDTVTVNSSEAIIDWDLTDDAIGGGDIVFLPENNTLLFTGSSDYTVLNRIVPTDATRGIRIDGTVQSLVGGNTGGNVWFYSPGGVIAGATSVFDVGGLVLTANAIDTSGGLFGANGEIRFRGAAGSTSAVVVENGAQITAPNNGGINSQVGSSYVALVAPRVVQGGNVNVNGSVAYVGAEQADLTINNGLFDINVTVGTTDANGVVHEETGRTLGPSSTPTPAGANNTPPANPDAQAVYMVAVPKNDAITMLVSGNIGYFQAASANIVNGEVILSAGHNVSVGGTDANPTIDIASDPVNALSANIEFGSLTLNASTTLQASDTLDMVTEGSQVLAVNNDRYDLTATAGNRIDIGGIAGGSFRAGRDVTLRAGTSAQGGTINIFVDRNTVSPDAQGTIQIDGNFTADTSAAGADDFFTIRNNGNTGIGEDAIAGDININISQGGSFTVGGNANFLAGAQGGKGEQQNGLAQGGNISLNLADAGTRIDFGGFTQFDTGTRSSNSGKIGGNGVGLLGADGVAGDVSLSLSGGTFTSGTLNFDIGASASSGSDAGTAQSNDATAGNFTLSVTGGAHDIGDINVNGRSSAGQSFNAAGDRVSGNVSRSRANILVDAGTLNVGNDIDLDLDAFGLVTGSPVDVATITTQNGGSLIVTDNIGITTRASGDSATGTLTGGSIAIRADGGTITAGDMFLSAGVGTRDSSNTEDYIGGNIDVVSQNDGTILAGFGSLSSSADASGVAGGNATGGDILINANNGSITFTSTLFASSDGFGGAGTSANGVGTGQGGNVTLRVEGVDGDLSLANAFLEADGSISQGDEGGFFFFEGAGGNGAGGSVVLDLLGGTFTAGDLNVSADGFGGSAGGGGFFRAFAAAPAPRLAGPAPAAFALAAAAVGTDALGMSAGDGGVGTGGDVVFNLDLGAGSATVANLSVTSNGAGGDGAQGDVTAGTFGGTGGDGIGGNATFNAISGTLNVATLTVSANGNSQNFGGRGGFGSGSNGGNGGNGIGGSATFNLDGTATINAPTVLVSADGFGGAAGGSGPAFDPQNQTQLPEGNGGTGGTGTGGDAVFNNTAGSISFQQLTVQSNGIGGQGGDSFGQTTGESTGDGGDGGDGVAGNATINLNQDESGNPLYSVIANGIGGNGGSGLDSGNGGNATGGVAALNINNVNVQLAPPIISAVALGGNGGFGDGVGGISGDGGSAQGGTARLEVTGDLGAIDLTSISMNASAAGGTGGNGADDFSFAPTGTGGTGGNGGEATGGTSEIIARTGGTITLPPVSFTFTNTGAGGSGGNGGYSYSGSGGDGGDGANGTGGTTRFLSQGGTINGNNIVITTSGQGGDAGTGGGTFSSYGGAPGTDGTAGFGSGGLSVIEVQEGSPGIINFGATTIESSGSGGGAGGRIEITDTSVDPAGLITFDSLNATVIGLNNPGLTGFYMFSDSGAITVNGDATVNVSGNIEFDFANDGRFDVSGNIDLTSGADILVGHTSNSGVDSITSGGTFDAVAQGDFNSMAGSLIVAGSTATVRAEQDATVDDITGIGLVDISARQDVTLNNGAVIGNAFVINVGAGSIVVGPQLIVQAGLDNGTPPPPPAPPPVPGYDPNFNATITGNVTSTGNIIVNAGGNATFVAGSTTISDNGLTVQTGDDIIIEAGALVEAAANPATSPTPANPFSNFNNLALLAGGLTPLSTAIVTPISSIVAAGDINANDFAIIMLANAVDGLGGTITADSLVVDINDAPPNGIAQSDDNGLLSAQCVQGNVCLGTLDVSNQLFVGQASNNDVIQAVVEGGNVNADIIRITTRRDLIVGMDGVASTFDGGTEILLESLEGDIDLRDAALTSDLLQLSAVNGSLLGSGSLASTNDIGITIGADLSAASIDTGGELTTVADIGGALEGFYSVPGSMFVGSHSVGTGSINYDAGGDFDFGDINVPGTDITLTAIGNVSIGSSNTADNIDINATMIDLGDVSAAGNIDLLATDIISFGSVTAGGTLTMDAGDIFGTVAGASDIDAIAAGTFNVANAIAGNTLTVDAFDVIIGAASGSAVSLSGASSVEVDDLSGDSANIFGGLVTIQDAILTGDLNIDGDDINIGNASADNINLSSVLDVRLDMLDAASDVVISAPGNVLTALGPGDIRAGGNIDLNGATSVQLDNLDAGGDITVAGGFIALLSADATGTLDLVSDTTIELFGDSLSGGAMTLNAGSDINIASLTSGGLLDIDAGGILTGDDLVGADLITIDAQSVDVASVSSTGNAARIITASGDAVLGTVSAATGVIVTANGMADIGMATSGGNTNITGTSVTLDNGTIGNNLNVNATSGDIAGTGTITVGGAIDLTATGNVGFGDLDAQGGDFTVDAGGDVSFASATGSNDVIMNAGGAIGGGDITAAGTAMLDAADIAVGNVNADMIDFTSGADILFDGLTSPNAIALSAANGTIGANTGNGDIDSGGDVDLAAQVINVGDVTSGGSVSADASAGDATFGTVDAANDITVSATGTPTLANAISGGNTDITGASVTLSNGDIGGDLTLNATAGDVDANGAVTVAGGIDLDATGNIGFGTLGAEGGDFTADAGGNIDFTQANGAANIDMNAGGDITFDGIDAATGVGIDAGGLVQGDVLSSGGGVSVSGESGITIDTLSANGDVELLADNGAIAVAGDLTTPGTVRAIGEDVLVNSSGDLEFSDTSASAGNVAVTALGSLVMDDTDASGDVNLTAGGSITLGDTEAGDRAASTGQGDIILDAGTDIILGSDTLAAGALLANAGGNVQVDALASGETVNISSADIAIAGGAQLGEGDFTADIQLSNTGTDPMFVGGADTTDGYSLSNDEFGNVQSGGSIMLRSDAASRQGDDLIIRDLTASAGQGGNIGADGAILFNGGDNTRIEGAVSLGNASADNGIFVDAAQGIAADAETAIVELTDANGGFAGEIGMTAPTITALTTGAAADVSGLDTAGIDERLGQSDGVDNPDGIFRADAITFNVTDQLLIQNTAPGTDFDDRRGYTVGSGSLQINVNGSDVPIVINGVATDAAGNRVTGIAVIAETGIATSGTGSSFDQASTINGCLIADPSSCAPVVPPGTGDNPDTPNDRDVIEEGLDPDTSGDPGSFFLSPLIELKDFEEFGYEPLIDEPVTGAGNDDLWLPPVKCERENAEGECVGEE